MHGGRYFAPGMISRADAGRFAKRQYGAHRGCQRIWPQKFEGQSTGAPGEPERSPARLVVNPKRKEEVMDSYSFVLNFNLPHREDNPEKYLDALYEAGCDDASVGIGQHGMIGLDFTRSAANAEEALRSAIEGVQTAIPGAESGSSRPRSRRLDRYGRNLRIHPSEHEKVPQPGSLPSGNPSRPLSSLASQAFGISQRLLRG